MSQVFIRRFDPQELRETITEAMEWVGVRATITPGTRVFIKPNLVWKVPTPGATTTSQAIRALVEYLRDITPHITIGESDGGQDCFWAEDAFRSHGLYELVDEFGVEVVNLSKQKTEKVRTKVSGKTIEVELPSMLLHDIDVFITMPVPKVHYLTRVSLAFKNQWGCLGNSMRLTEHPRFPEAIVATNRLLKPKLTVCDGTYFLNHTGPLVGEPVPMNLLIVSDDIGAASLACCEIMQIDYRQIRHFRVAQADGMFPRMLDEIRFNQSPVEFRGPRFYLKRTAINYIQLMAFHNRWFNRLLYDSVFADALHEILWFIRRNALIKRFLYGRYGDWEARRHGAY